MQRHQQSAQATLSHATAYCLDDSGESVTLLERYIISSMPNFLHFDMENGRISAFGKLSPIGKAFLGYISVALAYQRLPHHHRRRCAGINYADYINAQCSARMLIRAAYYARFGQYGAGI